MRGNINLSIKCDVINLLQRKLKFFLKMLYLPMIKKCIFDDLWYVGGS